MKKFDKKKVRKFTFIVFSKLSLILLMVGLVVVVPTITLVFNNRKTALDEKFFGKKSEYQGIIKLWNVDTFEGGSSSRASFLENVAVSFEKKYKGAFIKVENLTIDEMVANIKMGVYPNLFTFGVGVASFLEDKMVSLPDDLSKNILSNFYSAGLDAGLFKAAAYATGGYVLISTDENIEKANGCNTKSLSDLAFSLSYDLKLKKSTKHIYSLTFGGNDYASAINIFSRHFSSASLVDLASSGVIDVEYNSQSSYNAYAKFISGKSSMLLGSQRDIARMENRVKAGLESDLKYEALGEYTDLVNYISIIDSEESIVNVCKDFVSYLLSEDIQKKLADIGLLSAIGLDLYEEGALNLLEEAITESTIVGGIF